MISVTMMNAESFRAVMAARWDTYTLHQDADAKDHVPATDGKSRSLAEQEYGPSWAARDGDSRGALVAWSDDKPVAVVWYTIRANALSGNGMWRERKLDVDCPWLLDSPDSIDGLKLLVPRILSVGSGATIRVHLGRAWRTVAGLIDQARDAFISTQEFTDFGSVLLKSLPKPANAPDHYPEPRPWDFVDSIRAFFISLWPW